MNVDEAEALLSIRHSRRERAEIVLLAARRALDAARTRLDMADREQEWLTARAAALLLGEPVLGSGDAVRARLTRVSLSAHRIKVEEARKAACRQVADAAEAVSRALAVFVPSRRREETAELVLTSLRRERFTVELRAEERRMAELIELRAAWRRM